MVTTALTTQPIARFDARLWTSSTEEHDVGFYGGIKLGYVLGSGVVRSNG